MKINIAGLDKIELAVDLYYASVEPDSKRKYVLRPKVKAVITDRFERSKFLDKVFERTIKVDFSTDLVDISEYDRVNGSGKFQEIVTKRTKIDNREGILSVVCLGILALVISVGMFRYLTNPISQTCLSARNYENASAVVGSMALETGDYETITSAKGDLDSAISKSVEVCR